MFLAAAGVPESPNFLTYLSRYFDNPFFNFLSDWDSVFFSFLVAVLLSLVFIIGTRKNEMIPTGLQNILETIVESFRNFIVGILGKDGEKYVPFLGTLFLYILCMNFIGLVPLMKSPSSSLNVTIALAICVFVLVQYLNIKNMGIRGFLYHLAGSPKDFVGWLIAPLMFPIEILTQVSRPVTLALRLFGNILGEKILLAFFTVVGVTLLVFFPVQLPFVFLGVLTGLMQALVFTLLSTIYILLSVPHSEEHNH
jgi:F-type H+-transporting ATPase subunit a